MVVPGTITRKIHHHYHCITVNTYVKQMLMDVKAIPKKGYIVWVILHLVYSSYMMNGILNLSDDSLSRATD